MVKALLGLYLPILLSHRIATVPYAFLRCSAYLAYLVHPIQFIIGLFSSS